jgi:hypothetical protein
VLRLCCAYTPQTHASHEHRVSIASDLEMVSGTKIRARVSESEREIGARGHAARGEAHSRRPFTIRHIENTFYNREHILWEGRLTREGP